MNEKQGPKDYQPPYIPSTSFGTLGTTYFCFCRNVYQIFVGIRIAALREFHQRLLHLFSRRGAAERTQESQEYLHDRERDEDEIEEIPSVAKEAKLVYLARRLS